MIQISQRPTLDSHRHAFPVDCTFVSLHIRIYPGSPEESSIPNMLISTEHQHSLSLSVSLGKDTVFPDGKEKKIIKGATFVSTQVLLGNVVVMRIETLGLGLC